MNKVDILTKLARVEQNLAGVKEAYDELQHENSALDVAIDKLQSQYTDNFNILVGLAKDLALETAKKQALVTMLEEAYEGDEDLE